MRSASLRQLHMMILLSHEAIVPLTLRELESATMDLQFGGADRICFTFSAHRFQFTFQDIFMENKNWFLTMDLLTSGLVLRHRSQTSDLVARLTHERDC
jgi:hypothetical protein